MRGRMEKRSANAVRATDRAKLRASTTRLQFQRRICSFHSCGQHQRTQEKVVFGDSAYPIEEQYARKVAAIISLTHNNGMIAPQL